MAARAVSRFEALSALQNARALDCGDIKGQFVSGIILTLRNFIANII